MANGSKHGGIEGADKSAKATVGAGMALAGGIAAALVGGAINANQKKKEQQQRQDKITELQNKIAAIDRQISGLSGGLIGKYWNASEIEQLESLRSKYQEELNRLTRG